MPVVHSKYVAKNLFKNGFISTVYSGLVRKINGVIQKRERLELHDGDFLDLDWSFAQNKSNSLIIVLHGLEGNAQRPYMTGTAAIFNSNDIDCLCINFRGCGGEDNRLFSSYHSGKTDDLDEVITHVLKHKNYDSIFLKGFSLGGNVVLKYLGEGRELPDKIKSAVAVSVPCSLYGSMIELHKFKNVLYHDRFKKHLIGKLKIKQKAFPERVKSSDLKQIKSLKDFDDFYTSRANGFKDALDYYEKCSSLQFLDSISIPTLIINAENDSFLSEDCYPKAIAEANTNLFLEIPKYGGHVGFHDVNNVYYNETRSLEFLKQNAWI
ncbi:MAG: alpha/beta hydrolase [Bacteroidetes bacterium MedPE-SWsnd-G2]|nr:MAG: alpha/beta hydrolase [Bacteroidetes bacterium MedPE-SWsnd-G2]